VTTSGHAGSDGRAETDGARGELRLSGHQYLQDVIPVQVGVGIDVLGSVISSGVDNEAVIRVNESILVKLRLFVFAVVTSYLALSTA
jgi:hypothetical protein